VKFNKDTYLLCLHYVVLGQHIHCFPWRDMSSQLANRQVVW